MGQMLFLSLIFTQPLINQSLPTPTTITRSTVEVESLLQNQRVLDKISSLVNVKTVLTETVNLVSLARQGLLWQHLYSWY